MLAKWRLLLALLIALNCVKDLDGVKMITFEQNFVELLNNIRQNPQSISQYIQKKYQTKFQGNCAQSDPINLKNFKVTCTVELSELKRAVLQCKTV
jgi:hypothetical protein